MIHKSFLLNGFRLSFLLVCQILSAQHNNELYINGAVFAVNAGATVSVLGDVHCVAASGRLENNGLIEVHGNFSFDNLAQQRGTGRVRMQNSLVNIGQTQFIAGSCAVRGGSAQIGVNDGSFYNLELGNDQGIVWLNGTGNVADVRNAVDFVISGRPTNRIITANPSSLPGNGSAYPAVFGVMNATAAISSTMLDNTITNNGNSSPIDAAYVQGKLRRRINPAGGVYGFPLGLEPAGPSAARGVQYMHLNIGPNTYDCIEGYFEQGLSNAMPMFSECAYDFNTFYGSAHGQWVLEDITGSGLGVYEARIWPQDYTATPGSIYVITKDNAISGTSNECGASPVGLSRSGFNGFSSFSFASASCLSDGPDVSPANANAVCNLPVALDLTDPVVSYLWSTGATTSSISVSSTGTYSVTVVDANACTYTSSANVTAIPPATIAASSNSPVCTGSSLQLSATPGMLSYTWTGPGGYNATGFAPDRDNVQAIQSGTYTVNALDSNGCNITDTVSVSIASCAEICHNGVDDDGDGLMDENDPDCPCNN